MSGVGYAVIDCGGRQLKVSEGDTVLVDKGVVGKKIELGPVLALRSASGLKVGNPHVKGAKVTGTVEKEVDGPKITVVKYKRRKDSRVRKGHRHAQPAECVQQERQMLAADHRQSAAGGDVKRVR